MTTFNRKLWSESEKEELIKLWQEIASVTLISLITERTRASVRVQACRLKLPRRHRRISQQRINDWTKEDNRRFAKLLGQFTNELGQIHIVELAEAMHRSVDAVFDKLLVDYESERELFKVITISEMMRNKSAEVVKRKRRPNRQKERSCMTCKTPFWSEGFHNRMCPGCRTLDNHEGW